MISIEPPPPYSERAPVYERQPLMAARRPVRARADAVDIYSPEPLGKVQFGIIASVWCLGITACCFFGCRR